MAVAGYACAIVQSAIYDTLWPYWPYLSGDRQWLVWSVIALCGAVVVFAVVAPRLRQRREPRCSWCGHQFPPGTSLNTAEGACCSECGRITNAARRKKLVRPSWKIVVPAMLVGSTATAAMALWNNWHYSLCRAILPEWVVVDRAVFPNDRELRWEIDPIQVTLGLEVNCYREARIPWDVPPSICGNTFTVLGPERIRFVISPGGGAQPWVDSYACEGTLFGMDPSLVAPGKVFPPVGSPGFGGEIGGDPLKGVVYLHPRYSGPNWQQLGICPYMRADVDSDEYFSCCGPESGAGEFHRQPNGEWSFCAHYEVALYGAPALHSRIECSWNAEKSEWVPNPALQRREPDRALLQALAEIAKRNYDGTVERGILSKSGPLELPHPNDFDRYNDESLQGAVRTLSVGIMELACTGHAGEVRDWVARTLQIERAAAERSAENVWADLEWYHYGDLVAAMNGWQECPPTLPAAK